MKMNNQDNEQKRSILMSPRLKLFCKIMLNVAIPMVILIYTMPYSNWGILLAFITACLLTFFLVNGIMHESSNELLTLNQWMNEVVSGQLETRQTQTNNKTIQGIFFSFQRLVNHLTLLRDVCMGISQGDYSKFFVEAPPFDSVVEASRSRHEYLSI